MSSGATQTSKKADVKYFHLTLLKVVCPRRKFKPYFLSIFSVAVKI
jgi:hypothetical protein